MPGRPSSRLRQGLDNEVYQAVTHLLQDPTNRPDVRSLYQAIQRSNSSLKRKPKRSLEDSLERILDTLEDDAQEDEEAEVDKPAEEEPNIMNKSITGSWKIATPTTAPGTPAVNGTETKKRESNGEPMKKRIKREKNEEIDRSPPTGIALEDLGGVNDVKRQLMNLLTLPLLRPQRYADLNVPLPRGILLHGPPGCGKSMLARASAAKLGVPFIEIAGPSVVSGMSGESEKQIRDRFDEARKHAPCLIFIDEIDVIAPKRESSQSQMEKRIVAQLLISMDSLALDNKENNGKPVIVLAATNRPDTIDSALRRGGRFDTEINMGVPNEPMREKILRTQTRNTPISSDVDFPRLAKMTPGFVGADLRDLVGKAATWAMDRYQDALIKQVEATTDGMELDDNSEPNVDELWDRLVVRARNTEMDEPEGFEQTIIPMEAFLTVLPTITPSSKREGFATIPDTTWEDIGALTSVREELQTAIVEPIKSPDLYAAVGISAPTGVLLWGPPGCGKTLLAKAVAAESKANFISV
ncbi:AAA-domain-containing protein, partial [Aureobasidium melanogenum]